jgi:hypothetical protein
MQSWTEPSHWLRPYPRVTHYLIWKEKYSNNIRVFSAQAESDHQRQMGNIHPVLWACLLPINRMNRKFVSLITFLQEEKRNFKTYSIIGDFHFGGLLIY